jgi:hypothetical protein
MSRIKIGFLAAAACAIVTIALPLDNMAFGRGGGGGGGGGGMGGGHGFGGGGGMGGGHGFGGGGFGGGGMRSFGGGGMRSFGGGGMRSFGGGGIGAMHVAPSFSRAPAFSARSFSGVGMPHAIGMSRSVSGMRFNANRSLGVTRLGARTFAGASSIRGTRGALTNAALRNGRLAGIGLAGAGAGLVHTTGLGWHNGAWNGMRWNHRGDWWRHRPFFGWAGPVFWPWFYDDFFYYTFWDYGPYYYDDPFWAYGYGDIYGAMFTPYGYDGLAGWAPRSSRVHRYVARGDAPVEQSESPPPNQWSSMCGTDAQVASLPIDRITAAVSPDEQQRAALDALANASVQAAQTIKAACPTDVAYTPTGRLDAMERRMQAMVQAVAMIRPPLETFYGLLSDEQKARFNALGQNQRPDNPRSPMSACGPNAAAIPTWPQQQIEKAVRPSEGQRALLDRLKDASDRAADMLRASCPAEPPATPPARVAAMAARLDTMLQAVQFVRQALNDFYGSLTDEQKAQFNGIPPTVQNGQPKG